MENIKACDVVTGLYSEPRVVKALAYYRFQEGENSFL